LLHTLIALGEGFFLLLVLAPTGISKKKQPSHDKKKCGGQEPPVPLRIREPPAPIKQLLHKDRHIDRHLSN